MEAARVLALRGHSVTLYENRALGGALIEASVPEFKSDIRQLISYYVTQLKKLKIKVVEEKATLDTIKKGKFEAVVVAVGAVQAKPDVPGIDKPLVTDVLEVLKGKARVGQKVHVVGGGVIGVEVGLFLAQQGKELVFTTRQDDFMAGVASSQAAAYQEMLTGQKVTAYTGKRLESVADDGAVVVDREGTRKSIPADTVVLATGFVPQTSLGDQLRDQKGLQVYAVGDCVSPRMIYDAIHEAYIAARRI